MIFNAYAVLAIFVGLLELGLALAVVRLAISALARRRATADATASFESGEARHSLLLLVAIALLGASVASWPLLYLLLASYIPEWVGVMCIQGVTRVGTGSEGAAGWLPTLVRTLELTKPALVFAAGAWLALHLADRRTRTAPLAGRALGALLVVGALATIDAGAQLAYVGIPKKERFLAMGCCTVPQDLADRAQSFGLSVIETAPAAFPKSTLVIAFYALTGALVIGTRWAAVRSRNEVPSADPGSRTGPASDARRSDARLSDALTLAALAGLPVAVLFLSSVAAPVFLGRPDHRCAYCLLTTSPLAVVAIASYLVGAFATGWAGVTARLARTPETAAFLPAQRRTLLGVGTFGYLTALVLFTGKFLFA